MSSDGSGYFAPIVSYFGQKDANKSNLQIARESFAANQASAREAMRFEDEQARNQMKFQEQMSSTAMQRMKDDYKKAGINPLLGIGNPASTPTGSAGSGSSAQMSSPTMQDALGPAVASAMDVTRLNQQMQMQREQIGLMKSQKDNINMDTAVKAKGIPEAELKNEAYEILKPLIRSIREGSVGSSAADFKNKIQTNWAEQKQHFKNPKPMKRLP